MDRLFKRPLSRLYVVGPAQAVLADALDLPQECSVSEMVQAIEQLKTGRTNRAGRTRRVRKETADDRGGQDGAD